VRLAREPLCSQACDVCPHIPERARLIAHPTKHSCAFKRSLTRAAHTRERPGCAMQYCTTSCVFTKAAPLE